MQITNYFMASQNFLHMDAHFENNYKYNSIIPEREGFEPSVRKNRTHAFQACPFDRSGTSPTNKFAVQGAHDALVMFSGALRTLAVSLFQPFFNQE